MAFSERELLFSLHLILPIASALASSRHKLAASRNFKATPPAFTASQALSQLPHPGFHERSLYAGMCPVTGRIERLASGWIRLSESKLEKSS